MKTLIEKFAELHKKYQHQDVPKTDVIGTVFEMTLGTPFYHEDFSLENYKNNIDFAIIEWVYNHSEKQSFHSVVYSVAGGFSKKYERNCAKLQKEFYGWIESINPKDFSDDIIALWKRDRESFYWVDDNYPRTKKALLKYAFDCHLFFLAEDIWNYTDKH